MNDTTTINLLRQNRSPVNWSIWFAPLIGGIMMFAGLVNITGVFRESQVLDFPDPVFSFSFRHLLLLMGIAELIVAFLCLFTNNRTFILGLATWFAGIFVIYRIGLGFVGWHHSPGFLVDPLGMSYRTTDQITSLASVLTLIYGCVVVWLEKRFSRNGSTKPDLSGLIKISCPSCGGHIGFAIQNLGQQTSCPHCRKPIALSESENLKMFCVLCGGHIEFPAHAMGQKIPCPHCAKTITLLQQSGWK
jgi:hypothetical protein